MKANHKITRSILLGIILLILVISCSTRNKHQSPTKFHDGLKTESLEKMNIDRSKLKNLIDDIQNGKFKNVHSVLLVKNGKLVFEEYFDGWDRNEIHEIRSATKSIGSLLVGIAIDKGFIKSVDEKIYSFFKNYPDLTWDDRAKEVTIKHLLTMTSGYNCDDHRNNFKCELSMWESDNWIEYALNLPMAHLPGEFWAYNSASLNLLGKIIEITSNMSLPHFASKYLFEPLGINDFKWRFAPEGLAFMGGSAKMRPIDMAKFGLMILNEGKWNGKQIVSKQWVKESTKHHTNSWYSEYGYLWWIGKFIINNTYVDGFAAMGNGGQNIFVFPSIDLVAVFTQGNYNSSLAGQPDLMLSNYILPALNLPLGPNLSSEIDTTNIDKFLGTYEIESEKIYVTRMKNKLYVQLKNDMEKVLISHVEKNRFFYKAYYPTTKDKFQGEIVFIDENNKNVEYAILTMIFKTCKFKKVN